MSRSLAAAAVAATLLLTDAGAQNQTAATMETAAVAWDRGDYVTALTTYQQLLDGPEADRVLEPIALQTGELYHTTELTADGTAPQLAPDGRHATYETGTLPARLTRLVALDGAARPAIELPGYGAAFSPNSTTLAYLRLRASAPLQKAAAEVESALVPQRAALQAALTTQAGMEATIVLRDLATGRETELTTGPLTKSALTFGAGNVLLFAGASGNGEPMQIYSAAEGRAAAPVTSGPGDKIPAGASPTGEAMLFTTRTAPAGRGAAPPGGGRGGGGAFSLLTVADGRATALGTTERPSFSRDGRTLAYITRIDDASRVMVAAVADAAKAAAVRTGPERIEATSLSPDGSQVAFQMLTKEDWEIYVTGRDGSGERRLTREIQHDLQPQFLGSDRLLAVVGEARHRRSYLYDVATGARTRLFHNNSVRTIAPEYAWTASQDGTKVLISAERDGDTVSTARGIYLVDLTRKVTRDELRSRVAANLAAERSLRTLAQKMYAPIAAEVKAAVADASVSRIYGYEKALFDFDSKHITRPGNKLASAYLAQTYASFGYTPELQWFDARAAVDGRTANVLATLKGTVNPELVYVVSSHYDSVAGGPGADDDSSGTAALLEAARILAKRPQPATIVFASFTGEEAGLLGSREYVRRAVADKIQIVGALNNDMIGWANDHRLDNTIRYSNPGIRDVQHSAAMQFSNLITYDALYYKSTDAAAYYEAYGDIVGGIGSYPVLGNPHYHQSHDLLDTINHQLVTEVAKTTAATLMLLASSPSRLADLKVTSFRDGTATLSWRPSLEKGVTSYLVAYGDGQKPEAQQTRVSKAEVRLTNIAPGTVVSVKAVNSKGLEGWDWAPIVVK